MSGALSALGSSGGGINPAALAAFAQMAQGAPGGGAGAGGPPPGMMPQGMPQRPGGLPQGLPPGMPQGMPQGGPMAMPAPAPQPPAPPMPGQPMSAQAAQASPMPPPATAPIAAPGPMPGGAPTTALGQNLGRNVSLVGQAQGMARQGRNGDTMMAHMTPGEMAIPPQIQTPQVMAAIQNAMRAFGVNPSQFTAGSPTASRNPSTGAQQFSIWSAILPVLGAVAGSFIPGIGTAAGMAIGGAAGGAAGGLIDKSGTEGTLLQALGGGAGGYLGGAMSGLGSAAGSGAGTLAATGTTDSAAANALADQAAQSAAGAASAGAPAINYIPTGASGLVGNAGAGGLTGMLGSYAPYLKSGMLAGLGSSLGGALAPTPSTPTAYPPGFNQPLWPNGQMNTNPGQVSGSNAQTAPNFQNYNPYTSVTGQPQTFFPVV